jgi:Undecaprenyl pyrophosphate synthase
MKLLEGTFREMGENDSSMKKHNLRIRVFGRLELLEDHVLRAISKTMNATKDNRGKIVNIWKPGYSFNFVEMAKQKKSTGLYVI